jgi:hypothetical protein
MIYIIRLHGFDRDMDVVKIGHSRYPDIRYKSLKWFIAAHDGRRVEIEVLRELRDRPAGEGIFHTRFRDYRLFREYFRFHEDMLTFNPKGYRRKMVDGVLELIQPQRRAA